VERFKTKVAHNLRELLTVAPQVQITCRRDDEPLRTCTGGRHFFVRLLSFQLRDMRLKMLQFPPEPVALGEATRAEILFATFVAVWIGPLRYSQTSLKRSVPSRRATQT